jgi:hypothetical protein
MDSRFVRKISITLLSYIALPLLGDDAEHHQFQDAHNRRQIEVKKDLKKVTQSYYVEDK